jgi:uncharacterized membrane protein YeaQ/YmgE (transglycosylase-associated protein family)
MYEMMGVGSWILMGLIAGAIAKFLLPGKDPGGCVTTILIGIAGAFVGGLIATKLGFGGFAVSPVDDPRGLITATLGAILLLLVLRIFKGKEKGK